MSPEIVPATAEIFERFYGRPPLMSCHAWAVIFEGEPICIAGYMQDGESTVISAEVRPIMRERFSKTGFKLGKQMIEGLRAQGLTLYSRADEDVKAAGRFLERLGFQHLTKGVYICPASKSSFPQ